MIGDRPFRQFLFTNGLPWVEVFDGAPKAAGAANKEDGTVVVIGDLGTQFNRNRLPYRSVSLHNGSLTVADPTSRFRLFDGYGNRIAAVGGKLIVPLSTSGYYMRGDGKSGSFTLLLAAIESARITGYDPVNIVAHDLLSPISAQPTLNVSLTNVLSRPVTGRLSVSLGELKLEAPDRPVTLGANESRAIMVRVIGGVPVPDNSYPLNVAFKTDHDGQTSLAETMHVNVIAHFTPRIDGNLDDWKGILPQPILPSGASTPSAQETAWFPWKKFDTTTPAGLAVGYLAYDERNFYFAAKIADTTPDEGMHRMETANDDEYFFPAIAYKDGKQYNWPDGVRRYSYVKEPELPSGDFPYRDNVQIGFNVLGDDEKSYRPYPPGTRQEFGDVPTNDYEFALNPIAARYGGGTEIWKLHAPGMPEKNFYPRQPKGPLDGPVRDGQLAFTRDDQTRYVECAIPWTDIPQVKRALVVNKTIKFSFRVNDNSGNGCMELSRGRSVAKRGLSFQVYWLEHWTNEVEFSFQK